MLGSRATDKGTCTRISCMRVMFWLSRAYAPLWWDSNYASNDPLCVTLHFLRYSLVNLSNTGSAQSILSSFRVVNE